MNLKLILGLALFLFGIATAAIGISNVGDPAPPQPGIAGSQQGAEALPGTLERFAIPAVAALLMAGGGLLMGLSLGNWKRPRTHLEPGDAVVDPEGYHKMDHV